MEKNTDDFKRDDAPSFYETEFEKGFLESTKADYEKKANDWIGACNAAEYLKKVQNAIE